MGPLDLLPVPVSHAMPEGVARAETAADRISLAVAWALRSCGDATKAPQSSRTAASSTFGTCAPRM